MDSNHLTNVEIASWFRSPSNYKQPKQNGSITLIAVAAQSERVLDGKFLKWSRRAFPPSRFGGWRTLPWADERPLLEFEGNAIIRIPKGFIARIQSFEGALARPLGRGGRMSSRVVGAGSPEDPAWSS